MGMRLGIEKLWAVSAFLPKDITGAAQTGDYVKLTHHNKLTIYLQTGAWAGGTSAVTLSQATSAAGAGAKALAIPYYWVSTYGTSDLPVKTTVVSDTFNLSAANKLIVMEIDAQDLDHNNGFIWVACLLGTPGANADLVSGLYILHEGSRQGDPANLPTVIA